MSRQGDSQHIKQNVCVCVYLQRRAREWLAPAEMRSTLRMGPETASLPLLLLLPPLLSKASAIFFFPPFFLFFLFSYFQYVYVCIYISIVWRIMLILRVKSQIETKETSEIKEGESTYNTYSIYL